MAAASVDEAYLQCGICLELATNAVETCCCHQLFCETCVIGIDNCPICRKALKTIESHAIRRIIGILPEPCIYCKENVFKSNMDSHLKVCTERTNFTCAFKSCSFHGKKKEVMEHLSAVHSDELTSEKYKIVLCSTSAHDLIGAKKNGLGHYARLGQSGKYYCGKSLDFICSCCNGQCGTTSGCNCTSCFKLDLETRDLPKGHSLNKDGFAVRKGASWQGATRFYCGRKVMPRDHLSDGWCGPTDGHNCPACVMIQHQLEYGCYTGLLDYTKDGSRHF